MVIHPLKLPDRAVSDASIFTWGVFECDTAHRRSVAVLCILHKIRCNPMHPLYCALPGPYMSVPVTRNALVPRRYTNAIPRCRTSQHRRTLIVLSVTLWNEFGDSVSGGVRLAGFKRRPMPFQ